jgi:hypothetical protein
MKVRLFSIRTPTALLRFAPYSPRAAPAIPASKSTSRPNARSAVVSPYLHPSHMFGENVEFLEIRKVPPKGNSDPLCTLRRLSDEPFSSTKLQIIIFNYVGNEAEIRVQRYVRHHRSTYRRCQKMQSITHSPTADLCISSCHKSLNSSISLPLLRVRASNGIILCWFTGALRVAAGWVRESMTFRCGVDNRCVSNVKSSSYVKSRGSVRGA